MLGYVPICSSSKRKRLSISNPKYPGNFGPVVQHLRSTRARQACPKKDRQEDHEKGMCPEVGSEREIGIQRRRPNPLLEPSQVGRLISNEGEEFLSRPVTPVRELVAVFFLSLAQRISNLCLSFSLPHIHPHGAIKSRELGQNRIQ